MHRTSSSVFFERYRRQQARSRAQDVKTLPTGDRTSHSPAMLALLASLSGERAETEAEEARRENSAAGDASQRECASDLALQTVLTEIHDFFSTAHAALFQAAWGHSPPDGLGLSSVQLPDGRWKELHDFDTAYQVFVQTREDRFQARAAGGQVAALNVIKALCQTRH
jgi:hypothetical protein